MTNPKTTTDNHAGTFVSLLENILFVCCLIVIALRATYTEAPTLQSIQIQAAINDTTYSLCLSAVLILAFLLWLLAAILSGRFSYRITAMQIGLAILLVGAILASLNASNKRAAVTATLTLIPPLLMAALLAKLLNSHAKIKILLIVVISLGLVASWQSADQFFVSNEIMLQQYKENPNSILQPLGIRPGSLNQMLLEHRIHSKDVHASFTTSNSAGSFAILTSFAAIALLAELLKTRKSFPSQSGNRALAVIVLAAVLFGLALTRSKGAIVSFVLALAFFALLLRSKRPRVSKNIILVGCVIAVIVLIPLVAWYGLKFGRLPGGNSLLVRWQYWRASAQMFADHPLTGVGPGNFATFYPRYKPACAPETISDPHCFFLSILTQYGPPGLLGLLIIVLVPLWRTSLTCPEQSRRAVPDTLDKPSGHKSRLPADRFKKLATICIFAPVIAILLLRPFIIPSSTAATFDEKLYVILTDYIVPAAVLAVGFALLIKAIETTRNGEYAIRNTAVTAIALFSGLLGVLIHNTIDFAIFEPGVLTSFCAVLGCLIALDAQTQARPIPPTRSPFWLKTAATTGLVIITCGYFNYALLPVAKSTAKIANAKRAIDLGQLHLAHNLLDAATKDDHLSPDAPAMSGRLYLQHLYFPGMQQSQALDDAEQALFIAAQRNPQDYKNFESLTDVFTSRAQLIPDQKDLWLNYALDSASAAVSLYPGDAELHFRLAQIAEDLGQPDTALKHYQKAVQIEDGFREQFRMMYPGRKMLSRMPNEKYLLAKNRIEALRK